MKTFLALYMGSKEGAKAAAWNALSESARKERQQAGMQAWMAWGAKHASAIVDNGAPLGKTKLVNDNGISDIKNLLTGYVIVRAESADAAAKMFVDHPHFAIFPGAGVEIVECLPMPSMS